MRFLTFNLWHGLSPTNMVALSALEPRGRRELRAQLQVEVLRRAGADICFFQEVNPVAVRAAELERALEMDAVVQPDLVGLKLLGFGLPMNLNSGLALLTSRRLGLKRVDGVSLSRPGFNLVRSWGSWQLKEERFALFCESMVPRWGRVLLINTHLHHGLESTPDFAAALEKVGADMDLSASIMSELKERLARGNQRRAEEMDVLLRTLERYEKRYQAVVLAGDLNASPESELGRRLRERGFRDAWAEAQPSQAGHTFDHARNPANHILQSQFPLTLTVEDLSFSVKVKEALVSLARAQENRPRRIDYIWFRSASVPLAVKAAELVGLPDEEGMAPSDHFGVCAEIEPC